MMKTCLKHTAQTHRQSHKIIRNQFQSLLKAILKIEIEVLSNLILLNPFDGSLINFSIKHLRFALWATIKIVLLEPECTLNKFFKKFSA